MGLRVFLAHRSEGFLRHGRALKHGLADLPGRLLASPALADDVSSPSSSYPSAGCSSAEPASVSLDKIGAFPVSVSFRVYGEGNGQRQFELVAAGIPDDFASGGQCGQRGADFSGANAAEFLQLLNRDGFLELGQCLAHPFRGSGSRLRLNRGAVRHLQGHGGAGLSKLKRNVILGSCGAMFGGQCPEDEERQVIEFCFFRTSGPEGSRGFHACRI